MRKFALGIRAEENFRTPASLVKHWEIEFVSFVAVSAAIVATMLTTYLFLASAKKVLSRVGPKGIDAAARMIGFFVSAMGMGLIFDGVTEAFQANRIMTGGWKATLF